MHLGQQEKRREKEVSRDDDDEGGSNSSSGQLMACHFAAAFIRLFLLSAAHDFSPLLLPAFEAAAAAAAEPFFAIKDASDRRSRTAAGMHARASKHSGTSSNCATKDCAAAVRLQTQKEKGKGIEKSSCNTERQSRPAKLVMQVEERERAKRTCGAMKKGACYCASGSLTRTLDKFSCLTMTHTVILLPVVMHFDGSCCNACLQSLSECGPVLPHMFKQ